MIGINLCINLIGFKNLKGFKEFSPDRNKMMNEGNDNRILKIKNRRLFLRDLKTEYVMKNCRRFYAYSDVF